jgi:hypothetical protein
VHDKALISCGKKITTNPFHCRFIRPCIATGNV